MALTIYWSKRADRKFDKIISYLEEEWGDTVTKAFVKKVYDFLDILIEFPEIGSVEHAERNIRGFVIVKQLTLFYKIKEDKII
ncbi:MAG: type II toxin-antitoxin system RelE/ParE family toxin [Bacteroidales bacterium]|nr:MAG: type II toxin-antitoxin system RelE/ParE family toxin [Bacteroidales bacterium]